MDIRKARIDDLSRIAEIFIFNNRINYFPIFNDVQYSFKELQVVSFIDHYLKEEIQNLYVFDDGIIKGFIQINNIEVYKLYVDIFFQNQGIGHKLIEYAIQEHYVNYLWALEKNKKAIHFYQKHGFLLTGEKQFEEGTTEYLVKLKRKI